MMWKELYRDFMGRLQSIYPEGEAEAITNNLFTWASGEEQLMFFRKNERMVDKETILLLETALEPLLNHKPLQYITGECWFYNLKFFVSEAVLIPRPETEELVKEVLTFMKKSRGHRVLDIGTGSGCIAIAIKRNNKTSEITAIDISAEALEVAKRNAQTLETDINFLQLDFLTGTIMEKFDVIVSNPPYIPAAELLAMDQNVVSFEPHTALFVPDNDPLLFYKRIVFLASTNLESDGKVFMETHQHFAKDIAKLFEENGFIAGVKEDMFGKERFVWAIRCR